VPENIVFLLDCDNTLLDNDRVLEDLGMHLACEFGAESRDRYWNILETLRSELGYVDYLGALQRYRLQSLNDMRCQSAAKFDPRSASNFDPLWRRALAVALAPSERVGVAETGRARVGG
jgi:hypothetical protein